MESKDVIIGNPPFSKTNEGRTAGKKAVNLYPEFYKKSVELAKIVAMVMPSTKNQVNKKAPKGAFCFFPSLG